MHPVFLPRGQSATTVPVTFVNAATWPDLRQRLDARARAFADAAGFEPKAGRHLLLPAADGALAGVLFALEGEDDASKDLFWPGALAPLLPAGAYRFANAPHDSRLAALAFALGSYRFTRYRKQDAKEVKLELPGNVDGEDLSRIVDGVTLARDLINTPANDLGPAELEAAARTLAERHGAEVRAVVGDDLLEANFPLIHAVGRAAARPPRLIDLTWGESSHPKITLIGKGVCFDSGGLDIKPESGMLNMKKDMGGAAAMLALAHMVIDRGMKLRLRVLIPAVENAISGAAFRPRDVYRSRKGLTVEIGNTDAEGRLILADAIALADEDTPDLIADMATLTGGARGLRHERKRSAVAHAAVAAVRGAARVQGGGRQQRLLRQFRRLDHRRVVLAPVRRGGQGVVALRHLRLEPDQQARAAGGRRMPSRARALRALGVALWLRGKSTKSPSRRRRCARRPPPMRRSIPRRSRASA